MNYVKKKIRHLDKNKGSTSITTSMKRHGLTQFSSISIQTDQVDFQV